MEDINNILYSGEVPNIFTIDEKHEIIENMRNLEKQLDKSRHTDGSGTELFKLFVQRAKENLHIIIAMSPISESFRSFIAKFPALMGCCTINWMHQWPDDALNFVAYRYYRFCNLDSHISFEKYTHVYFVFNLYSSHILYQI